MNIRMYNSQTAPVKWVVLRVARLIVELGKGTRLVDEDASVEVD